MPPFFHVDPDASLLRTDYIAHQQTRFLEAVNRFQRSEQTGPAGLFVALFAWNWLNQEIPASYRSAVLAVSRNPDHTWLANLLESSQDQEQCITRFLEHWQKMPPDHPKSAALHLWNSQHPVNPKAALLNAWQRLQLFTDPLPIRMRRIQNQQKTVALEMGDKADQERLALIDALPDPSRIPPWPKVGFIPRMACSQSCRHCMFVWRTPLKQAPDPSPLLHWMQEHTESLLLTGGELHDQLPLLHVAIQELTRIRVFAILLNGATAHSIDAARKIFDDLEQARLQRPAYAPPAQIHVQISFDEFHQEIVPQKDDTLEERIPIANIANLVQAAVAFPAIRLILLHKQNRHNLSNALLKKGVIARLHRTLHGRGHELRWIRQATSARIKADPTNPKQLGPVIRDLVFTLASHPDVAIHLMSSTIDGYGRAALLDPSEFIHERPYLQQILDQGPPPGERFDIDPMIRADGVVSCFGAQHVWLGNLLVESRDKIRTRLAKDPLLQAMERFDPRILRFYQEAAGDLEQRIALATSPHHLWHNLTERATMRLHLTRRLLAC
ncbi:MAG: hypothetical protein G8237_12220 [Magnetococcales bacterium]|nr:hypothetical protein [Magnetococcales bacterium]